MASTLTQIIDRTPEGSPGSLNDSDLSYAGVLSDDYTHSKFLTVSYQGKGSNFVLKSKGTLDLLGTHFSSPKPKTSSQVKLITNLNGRDVEAKFDNKGKIGFWINFGSFTGAKPFNVSGKIRTNANFSHFCYSINMETAYKNLNISTKFQMKRESHPFLNQKLLWREKGYQLGTIYQLSLATFLFSRVHVFGQYKHQDYQFFFEHKLQGNGISSFASYGKTILAALYKTKKYKYVLKSRVNLGEKGEFWKVSAGTVAKIDNRTTLRAKVDTKGKFAISGKHEVNKNLTILAGTQVNLTEPSSFSTSSVVPIPIGLTLKFSFK